MNIKKKTLLSLSLLGLSIVSSTPITANYSKHSETVNNNNQKVEYQISTKSSLNDKRDLKKEENEDIKETTTTEKEIIKKRWKRKVSNKLENLLENKINIKKDKENLRQRSLGKWNQFKRSTYEKKVENKEIYEDTRLSWMNDLR